MRSGRDWVELNSVKAAAAYFEGWSKAAMMYHHVELAGHLGGDQMTIIKLGLEAIDHFRKAREFYAENVQLVDKFGTEPAVESKASAAIISFPLISMVSHTNDANAAISQKGVKGVFEHLEKKCSEIIAALSRVAKDNVSISAYNESFLQVMGAICDAAFFGRAASEHYYFASQ